jgi:hypothetical protein
MAHREAINIRRLQVAVISASSQPASFSVTLEKKEGNVNP